MASNSLQRKNAPELIAGLPRGSPPSLGKKRKTQIIPGHWSGSLESKSSPQPSDLSPLEGLDSPDVKRGGQLAVRRQECSSVPQHAEPLTPQLRGAGGAAGAEDREDRGGGADGEGRSGRWRRRVSRRGRASPAGSSSPMHRRLPPRCSPPGGKRRSYPGRTAGERRRRPAGPGPVLPGTYLFRAARRNLGARGCRV